MSIVYSDISVNIKHTTIIIDTSRIYFDELLRSKR